MNNEANVKVAQEEPAVSVVLIFYNTKQFLAEAIESVLAQTFSSWELILVDDGSTDGSREIALQFVEQFPGKLRYLQHENHSNLGKSMSRNLGIRCSRGQYIAFLDSDDVWLPHKLEQQIAIMESQLEAGMLYGRTQYWYSWTDKASAEDRLLKLGTEPERICKPGQLLSIMLRNESVRAETTCPYPSSVLVRRSALEKIGGFEESFRDLYDDVVFFAKAFMKTSVYVSGRCWDRYRMMPDQKFSNSYNTAITSGSWHPTDPNPAEYRFLTWLRSYLWQEKVADLRVWKSLGRCLLPYYLPLAGRQIQNIQKQMKRSRSSIKSAVRKLLPKGVQKRILRAKHGDAAVPPGVGEVRFGNLRRLQPLSRHFGYDRGQPVDRYYIEQFLEQHSQYIRGRVMEIGDNAYTCRFGGERVTQSDVLHAVPGNPMATIVGDLSQADHIPSETFDCIILTQTLLYVYDLRAAVRTIHRILKPGGVVLVTLPCICRMAQPDVPLWNDYWRFTSIGSKRLFEEAFPAGDVESRSYGNVLTATAFLQGMSWQELSKEELDYYDPDYQVTVAVRAIKPAL